jgi:hypothetical protein
MTPLQALKENMGDPGNKGEAILHLPRKSDEAIVAKKGL